MNPTPPEECANCGATIPRGAKACPECGADERTGWRENEDSVYDGIDLPGEPSRKSGVPDVNGVPWYWWFVGVVLLVSLAVWALGLR
jgi:hypothetical protein